MFSLSFALVWLAFGIESTQAAALPTGGAGASVCVLYFDNNTNDASLDVLRKGIADMVVTDLSAVPGVTVVEREKLEAVLGELELQGSKLVDPATAQKIGKFVGAKYAVTGAFAAVDPELRLDVRLIEVATARVVLAEKVTGKKDRLFALEEQLVAKFAKGLGATAAGAAVDQGAGDVATLLEFARGLDLADKGQAEEASKRLQAVVAKAPQFKLAAQRYTDVMRQLYAARDKRATALGGDDQQLVASATAAMKGVSIKTATGAALQRFMAYRVLLAKRPLAALTRLAVKDDDAFKTAFKAADRAQVTALMIEYVEQGTTFLEELETLRARGLDDDDWDPPFSPLSDAEMTRAEELGFGMQPEEWTFASVPNVACDVAAFIFSGRPSIFLHIDLNMAPTLAEIDKSYAARGLALLDKALADLKAHPPRNYAQRDTIRAMELYGESLLALGRKGEAIAKWQSILDAYPKAEEFADIEEKIKDALGIER